MNITVSFNDEKYVVPAGTTLNDFIAYSGGNYSRDKVYLFDGNKINQHTTLETDGTLQANKSNVTGN